VRAGPPGTDLYVAPDIYRRVRSTSADLVHCQGYHTFVPPLAMAAARRAGIPYLVTLHSGGHSSRVRRAIRPVQLGALRRQLAGAERLIAVSRFEAHEFAQRLNVPEDRFLVIPNGSDMPAVATAGTGRRQAGMILSVGRLERYKGHHRLIDALPRVRRERPDARLVILGSGPYLSVLQRRAIERGVGDAVEIRSVPRPEVAGLMKQAQVVALLSDYESQGLAVHEALALGCRILVSRSSALAEVADLPQATGVAPSAGPDEIADMLLAQLAAPPEVADPPALPSWDACAAQLMEVYRAVLSGEDSGSGPTGSTAS
jgi:glycosyltransferase involved in cell wall biosynthesis